MFERFDTACRAAVATAQAEARRLRHGFIGTEHLFIGLTEAPHGYPAQALRAQGIDIDAIRQHIRWMTGDRLDADALALLGIDLDRVRDAAELRFGRGALDWPRRPAPRAGHLPLTRRAKSALGESLVAARRFGSSSIEPAHLLLGVLDADSGVVTRALRDANVDVPALRLSIAEHLDRRAA